MTINIKILTIIALSYMLCGCASVRSSYAPDGRKAYALNCSGSMRGWDKCMASAGEICGTSGYDVLDRENEKSGGIIANKSGLLGINSSDRSMLISCKK